MIDLEYFINTLSGLMVLINPFGAVIIHLALTKRMNWRDARQVARAAALSAGLVLIIAMAGQLVLNFFNISLQAFAISGGILMFIVGLAMVQAQLPLTNHNEEEKEDGMHRSNMGVLPLGIPVLAGPGGITFMTVKSGEVEQSFDYLTLVGVILVSAVLIYLVLLYSRRFLRFFGRTGINIMGRVAGIFVIAMGVDMIFKYTMEMIAGVIDVIPPA